MLVAREISPTTSSFLTWLAPRRHVCGFVRRALCVCVWPSTDIPTGRRKEPKKQEEEEVGGDRTISLLLLLLLLRAIGW